MILFRNWLLDSGYYIAPAVELGRGGYWLTGRAIGFLQIGQTLSPFSRIVPDVAILQSMQFELSFDST